jgi:hypothetical protein
MRTEREVKVPAKIVKTEAKTKKVLTVTCDICDKKIDLNLDNHYGSGMSKCSLCDLLQVMTTTQMTTVTILVSYVLFVYLYGMNCINQCRNVIMMKKRQWKIRLRSYPWGLKHEKGRVQRL